MCYLKTYNPQSDTWTPERAENIKEGQLYAVVCEDCQNFVPYPKEHQVPDLDGYSSYILGTELYQCQDCIDILRAVRRTLDTLQ